MCQPHVAWKGDGGSKVFSGTSHGWGTSQDYTNFVILMMVTMMVMTPNLMGLNYEAKG